MRFSRTLLTATIAAALVLANTLHSRADEFDVRRLQARQDLARAKLELRSYLHVEYPRQRRYLNAEIRLAEAEIAVLRRRDQHRSLFDPYVTAQWIPVPHRHRRLCILEAELRFQDLLAERNAFDWTHVEHWRMLEMDVQRARLRVAGIEGGTDIILETASK